eukprot:TRINITY_DN1076_c0_g1_i1.p1 TRINITY_DN1076_c0_g1~~TRINITY_DN1076_c0_g1_i1.p1  ORF type:complete len:280 (+),score=69.75 TRINITY_DN1076_c0_g1_i1:185-1024(+)
MSNPITLQFLGTGTSHGVPCIGCDCAVCHSVDPKDNRLNACLLIRFKDSANVDRSIFLDFGNDIRHQCIKYGIKKCDTILLSHAHSDHVGGLDNIRSFQDINDPIPIPIYCQRSVAEDISERLFFYFFNFIQKGGGIASIDLRPVELDDKIDIFGVEFEPLLVKHGKLDIYGYRFNNIAYVSDVSFIPPETLEKMRNLKLLIVDCLKLKEHPTHFNLRQALEVVHELKPEKTLFTHMCHHHPHCFYEQVMNDRNSEYFTNFDVSPAYDGLVLQYERINK